MRSSKLNIIKNNAGQVQALLLEPSYCAEQERGIAPIQELLGVQTFIKSIQFVPISEKFDLKYKGPFGVRRCEAKNFQENNINFLIQEENKSYFETVFFTIDTSPRRLTKLPEPRKIISDKFYYDLCGAEPSKRLYKKQSANSSLEKINAAAGWSDQDIVILSCDLEVNNFLKDFYSALKNKRNTAVWITGSNNPFGRSGLAIGLIDRIELEYISESEKSEKDYFETYKEAIKTKIFEKIPRRKYYAISPKRNNTKKPSKFNLICWLNPADQEKNKFGWYTYEELIEWNDGKDSSIILKKNKKSI